jgi:hypothetical protein
LAFLVIFLSKTFWFLNFGSFGKDTKISGVAQVIEFVSASDSFGGI